jgi:hypothetical protein
MPEITGEIVIDRTAVEVFDFVADERTEPLYNPALLASEKLTNGAIGAGTRFGASHAPARHPVEMTIEVTDYDRPRTFGSRTTMAWADVRGTLTFEAAGAGTRLRWAWHVQPKGLARVLTPVISVVGRRQERAVWEGLKRYLESSSVRGNAPTGGPRDGQPDPAARVMQDQAGRPASRDEVHGPWPASLAVSMLSGWRDRRS